MSAHKPGAQAMAAKMARRRQPAFIASGIASRRVNDQKQLFVHT